METAPSTPEIRRPTAGLGIASVTVAKSLDAGTTFVGLSFFERIEELNPVVRAGFEAVGVLPALVWFSVASVLLVTVATETGVLLCRRHDRPATLVRVVGYGFPTVTATAAATHNGLLIVRCWS
ncbi:hypothetical protein [Haloarchaeobius salinus]|uniref:hypothetical protein n=1 Tax=Haloarchaeobius salinus TaxID=1198298 RepID=UPI00210C60B7|nr:hypothetical protein [Haloarchaeobius salinus]